MGAKEIEFKCWESPKGSEDRMEKNQPCSLEEDGKN